MSKCCSKCACRQGSPEREAPWGWMRLVEGWEECGAVFYCHESVPGHYQEVKDERPRWRLCSGFLAHMKSLTTQHLTQPEAGV